MGDVLSLIEKAEEVSDAEQAEDLERKIRKQQFTLEDFLAADAPGAQDGPLSNVLGMMPGMGKAMKQLRQVNMDERELDRLEAIILSMTPAERANPTLIDGSRRKRIAQGSGTTVQAVNQLVKQFGQMRKLMAQLAKGKMPDPAAADGGMREPRQLTWSAPHGVRIRLRRVGSRRTRSGASSSPTAARRATGGRSRRSATTTRRPTPR